MNGPFVVGQDFVPSYGTKLLNITSYRFRCDHPSAPAPDQGRCGENLECKLRDDLDANDEPQVKAMVCAEKSHQVGEKFLGKRWTLHVAG